MASDKEKGGGILKEKNNIFIFFPVVLRGKKYRLTLPKNYLPKCQIHLDSIGLKIKSLFRYICFPVDEMFSYLFVIAWIPVYGRAIACKNWLPVLNYQHLVSELPSSLIAYIAAQAARGLPWEQKTTGSCRSSVQHTTFSLLAG